jgi:hypothetical protein
MQDKEQYSKIMLKCDGIINYKNTMWYHNLSNLTFNLLDFLNLLLVWEFSINNIWGLQNKNLKLVSQQQRARSVHMDVQGGLASSLLVAKANITFKTSRFKGK